MQIASPKILALLGLASTNLFWASNAVIARYASSDIPPFTLAFGRWLLAFLFLLPFAWPHLRGQTKLVKQHVQLLFILGLLGIATYNTVLYLAAHATTAVNITLVSSSLPLIILLMSAFLLRIMPTKWQVLGIALSLIGVSVIITRGDISTFINWKFNPGDILIFLIACVWAFYSVLLRKYPLNLHPIAMLTVLVAMGLPVLLILTVLEASILPAFSLEFTPTNTVIFIYIAIFPSILAYAFWGHGIKILGPNIAALSTYLMPLFTVVLAVPLLGEKLYSYHSAGGMLILLGLYLGSVFKQNSRA